MRALVLMAVVSVVLNIFPDTWDEIGRMMRDDGGALAQRVVAAMERGAEMWDRLGRHDEEMLAVAAPAVDGIVSGTAVIIDGDTLAMGWPRERVRLHGIDAPESEQLCLADGERWSCGRDATRALGQLIGIDPVACEARDVDRYGRVVAVCRIDGQDVNAWMVAEGWALAYRRYSMDYVDEEAAARAAKRGVWRGELVAPWDWRRGVRFVESPLPAPPSEGTCLIKGNINSDGERIYHMPGGRYYEATVISTGQGERWFCSEAAAREAGWRRSAH